MTACPLVFHHIGVAVRVVESAVRTLHWLGYEISEPVLDPAQKVLLRLCTSASMPVLEIVHPAGDDSPANRFIRDQDYAVYHLCYSVRSIDDAVQQMKASGSRLILLSEKKPAPLFANRYVGFYYFEGMGIVELLEEPDAKLPLVGGTRCQLIEERNEGRDSIETH